jgi:hypothetical protein
MQENETEMEINYSQNAEMDFLSNRDCLLALSCPASATQSTASHQIIALS